ncbi:elongation factor P [Candidatus Uhrbacteria bacterium]|nr:elongation factor P [Candidatus Uhrbacteria bacterium]
MSVLPSLNSIRVGMILLYNGEPYQVQIANFVRMQQRKPVMQTKMKHLVTGKVLEYSFKPGERVEEADLEKRKANYLYSDQTNAYFMDQSNYEQFGIELPVLGDSGDFIKEGTEVVAVIFNGNPISVELPKKIDLKVTSAPPAVKGDSAQGRVMKVVTLETGATIQAPLFINEGDIIRINTETMEYVERV